MKREELDKLKVKYYAGETSIEEERLLKELENEGYFNSLKESESISMDWNFDSFLEKVEESDKVAEVRTLPKRLIALISIAATLILGFFFLRQHFVHDDYQAKPMLASTVTSSHEQKEMENFNKVERNLPTQKKSDIEERLIESKKDVHWVSSSKTKHKNGSEEMTVTHAVEEEMYVEVNGVKIYDEDKAFEITETALHLATTNLKKGMEGVEHIRHIKIEI